MKTTPPPLPPEPSMPVAAPPPLPVENAAWQSPTALESDFEVREVGRQTSSEPAAGVQRTSGARFDPRLKLRTPQDLRTAIILREVFGPPRSLQELNLTNAS